MKAGSGFLSQHTRLLHFGLDESDTAEHVRIVWPSSEVQEFRDLKAGYRYRITEGSEDVISVPFVPRTASEDVKSTLRPENEPSLGETWLLEPVPLPDKRTGPGFICVTAGQTVAKPNGLKFVVVDLRSEPQEIAASYALFRRYLFDYRADLTVPFLILVDEAGLAHKIYPSVPDSAMLTRDLALMREPDRARLALPFAGRYLTPPRRNHFRMGAAMYWAGYPEQALIYLNAALRENPDTGKAHLAVGHIHFQAGRLDLSRKYLVRATELIPNSAEAWMNMGSLELSSNNNKAAIEAFNKAIALRPDSAPALAGAGQAYARSGDASSAERLLRRSLEVDTKFADAFDQLGLLLARQNRLKEARDLLEQAITSDPNHLSAINNLGVLYMQMSQPNDAIAAFRYGIGVGPQNEIFYMNLARVYVQSHDWSQARNVLSELLQVKPDSHAARKALDELADR